MPDEITQNTKRDSKPNPSLSVRCTHINMEGIKRTHCLQHFFAISHNCHHGKITESDEFWSCTVDLAGSMKLERRENCF